MRYIKDEAVLLERAKSYLLKTCPIFKTKQTKRINPDEVIEDVEFDPMDGADGFSPSYWVYLKPGYVTEGGYGCHIVHEDTLAEVKNMLHGIVYDPNDIE